MLTNRLALLRRTARLLSRGGFTLVELLVVIGIIAILAGVALGPITRGITQAKESATMQVTRQIGLAEFAYSNDNNQQYPFGPTAEAIAIALLQGNYVTDPSIFWVSGTPGDTKVSGLSAPFSGLAANNVSFDFMQYNSNLQGLSSTAADGTPVVQMTGGTLAMAPTGPINCTLDATKTTFGTDGISVMYKSNSAVFKKAIADSATTAHITGFVDASYSDPLGSSYALVKP
jgi:prepilin-type N-terminal cleavage/methylation domain-containing protein